MDVAKYRIMQRNHCLFKAKDTKGAVGNTVDYSSLTICQLALTRITRQVSWTFDLKKMGNSKKFPISQKAHYLYEKIIFCHRPLLYLQTKKIPRTSQSMVIATQTPKIPIWNTMVSR